MKEARFRLILDVVVSLNGAAGDEVRDALHQTIRTMIDRHGLTGDTEASTITHNFVALEVPASSPFNVFSDDNKMFGRLLADYAQVKGLLEDDTLDDAVHEVASGIASNVNNGGISEQCRFLAGHLGFEEARKIVDEG